MDNNISKRDIKMLIKKFISRSLVEENIGDDQNINDLGLINSLFGMFLILYIEKELNISIEPTTLNFSSINTINKIVDVITEQM